jgi:hypothetical protein
MSLREGCNAILSADCVSLAEKLHRKQSAAMRVDQFAKCASCNTRILPVSEQAGLVVFFCSHVYHQRCLKGVNPSGSIRDLWCIICQKESKPKRTPVKK